MTEYNNGNKVLYLNSYTNQLILLFVTTRTTSNSLFTPKLQLYKNSLKSILCNTNLSSRHHVPHWKNYKAISTHHHNVHNGKNLLIIHRDL